MVMTCFMGKSDLLEKCVGNYTTHFILNMRSVEFICGLFDDAVSNSVYVAWNVGVIHK